MEIITKDKVLTWAKQYKDSLRTNGEECLYSIDGKTPNCIVANFLHDEAPQTWQWVLKNLDMMTVIGQSWHKPCQVNLSTFPNVVATMPSQLVSITTAAQSLLYSIQSNADLDSDGEANQHWGEAIRLALR